MVKVVVIVCSDNSDGSANSGCDNSDNSDGEGCANSDDEGSTSHLFEGHIFFFQLFYMLNLLSLF